MANHPHPVAAGRYPRAAVILVLAGFALTGCGRSVSVAAPTPPAPVAAECAGLQAGLPDEMAGQRRVAVSPDTATTAAWGTPAILWRCGVDRPGALTPTSQLLSVDGTDWLPEQLTEGVRFTSVAGVPHQELTVPAQYPDAAGLLTLIPASATGPAPGQRSPSERASASETSVSISSG